jgi:hypothetical protein
MKAVYSMVWNHSMGKYMTLLRILQSRITTKMKMKTLYSAVRNYYKSEYMSVYFAERNHYKRGFENRIFIGVESLQG